MGIIERLNLNYLPGMHEFGPPQLSTKKMQFSLSHAGMCE